MYSEGICYGFLNEFGTLVAIVLHSFPVYVFIQDEAFAYLFHAFGVAPMLGAWSRSRRRRGRRPLHAIGIG